MTILAVSAPTETTGYRIEIATAGPQVRAAQRLRHEVFAGELGAVLRTPTPGLDIDEFDEYCDHLIIRVAGTDEVVGTYRMLPPDRAALAGRLYADAEFDLAPLAQLRGALVETGRSCVHPDHRTGAVINLMWAGITRYLHLAGYRWLVGCASIPLADGGATAAGVWEMVRDRHLAPPAWRVQPRTPWPVDQVTRPAGRVAVPPLLRGYLRLGAWVCGPPAHDPDFGVADLFLLHSMERMDPRYVRHFLGLLP
ncbi:MAG TPA: GNAT family N-acyltransferase [Micromonosporaceae bacterium]|nr:GNAT family N-acyltransferase [Micromonosporaceae bacterium]